MSTKEKWVVYIIVIAVIAGLAWWYMSPRTEQWDETIPANQEPSTAAEPSLLPTSAADVSDTAITQDTAAIDAGMANLSIQSADMEAAVAGSQAPAPDLTQ